MQSNIKNAGTLQKKGVYKAELIGLEAVLKKKEQEQKQEEEKVCAPLTDSGVQSNSGFLEVDDDDSEVSNSNSDDDSDADGELSEEEEHLAKLNGKRKRVVDSSSSEAESSDGDEGVNTRKDYTSDSCCGEGSDSMSKKKKRQKTEVTTVSGVDNVKVGKQLRTIPKKAATFLEYFVGPTTEREFKEEKMNGKTYYFYPAQHSFCPIQPGLGHQGSKKNDFVIVHAVSDEEQIFVQCYRCGCTGDVDKLIPLMEEHEAQQEKYPRGNETQLNAFKSLVVKRVNSYDMDATKYFKGWDVAIGKLQYISFFI